MALAPGSAMPCTTFVIGVPEASAFSDEDRAMFERRRPGCRQRVRDVDQVQLRMGVQMGGESRCLLMQG